MKVKIILALVWTGLCMCERQQRSTVLTDESKRILEHFDFSNFDKQEALNYLDRQRYENQIRGKRSHSKFKKDRNEEAENVLDTSINPYQLTKKEFQKLQFSLKPRLFKDEVHRKINQMHSSEFPFCECEYSQSPKITTRNRRAHRSKKKHRSKSRRQEEEEEEEEEETQEAMLQKRKKKKKKKRHYWDHWSEWSPCSVTCGRGRKIRWRKCVAKNCTTGELEMGEKTCQLPACNLLTKLLGL